MFILSKNPIKSLWLLCFVFAFGTGLTACSPKTQNYKPATTVNKQVDKEKIATSFQQQGIITRDDYFYLDRVWTATNQGRPLSDEDLKWLLLLMHKPSTNLPIVNSMVMGLFLDLKVKPAEEQRHQILTQIRPLLSSKSELDRKYAARVVKKLDKLTAT